MALNNSKQSYLEIKGIEERHNEIVRSEYYVEPSENVSNVYSESHENAISNGDVKGKGTNNGGHQHYIPDYTKSPVINYSNFDTTKGGGKYDIEGRNGFGGRDRLVQINIYNKINSYGPNSVDTTNNINEGQYVLKG